jgi:hypothetical protein
MIEKKLCPAFHGHVQPHAGLLSVPPDDQLLCKVMTAENLLRSICGSYLHFNRVDTYTDDKHDGEQLPREASANAAARFQNDPSFTAASYYDRSRSRTYACCFSLENSDYIWNTYGAGSPVGKAGIVFDFGKLRSRLKATHQNSALDVGGDQGVQIFDLNYGLCEYIERPSHQTQGNRLRNPIEYAYLKDKSYAAESELRVTLSPLGIGHYAVGGTLLSFPTTMQMDFDFKAAIADGTIREIEYMPLSASEFIRAELSKLGILTRGGQT